LPFAVATLTRVKLDAFSAVSFAFTSVVTAVVSHAWNDASHSALGLLDISAPPRNEMYVVMKDCLTSRSAVVAANVEAAHRRISLEDLRPSLFEQSVDRPALRCVELTPKPSTLENLIAQAPWNMAECLAPMIVGGFATALEIAANCFIASCQ
jgi:hypothetical protein